MQSQCCNHWRTGLLQCCRQCWRYPSNACMRDWLNQVISSAATTVCVTAAVWSHDYCLRHGAHKETMARKTKMQKEKKNDSDKKKKKYDDELQHFREKFVERILFDSDNFFKQEAMKVSHPDTRRPLHSATIGGFRIRKIRITIGYQTLC
ncbi:hypothetical protein PIB30_082491 [Stylosanthes scabra]|uniref:Uncharacterized protein n=1 Tax=Stylosanthes scabra TaxID=79078 RepID=A0ABU6ZQK2_9FABA|nr:hypothetical protein [Stylosanthes scabra]